MSRHNRRRRSRARKAERRRRWGPSPLQAAYRVYWMLLRIEEYRQRKWAHYRELFESARYPKP